MTAGVTTGEAADREGVALGEAVTPGDATGEAADREGVALGEAVTTGVAPGLRGPGTPVSCNPAGDLGDGVGEGKPAPGEAGAVPDGDKLGPVAGKVA